jgi:Protein of unknown function (DUF4240)
MNSIMDKEKLKKFWLIIDSVPNDIKIDEDNDYDLYSSFLDRVLSKGKNSDREDFVSCLEFLKSEIFNENIKWGNLIEGISKENLEYFYNWIISRGSMVYASIFIDPKSLEKSINQVVKTEYIEFSKIFK